MRSAYLTDRNVMGMPVRPSGKRLRSSLNAQSQRKRKLCDLASGDCWSAGAMSVTSRRFHFGRPLVGSFAPTRRMHRGGGGWPRAETSVEVGRQKPNGTTKSGKLMARARKAVFRTTPSIWPEPTAPLRSKGHQIAARRKLAAEQRGLNAVLQAPIFVSMWHRTSFARPLSIIGGHALKNV